MRVKSTMGADGMAVCDLGDQDLDNAFAGGSVNCVLGYFKVPTSMNYLFKNNFCARTSIQLGARHTSIDVFINTVIDKDDLHYTLNVKKAHHPLHAGLLCGIGHRFTKGNGMNLSVQYYYGRMVVRVSDTTPNQSNRALYIGVGIPIGTGKAGKTHAENDTNESIDEEN